MEILLYTILLLIVALALAIASVYLHWSIRSRLQRSRARKRPLRAQTQSIWHNPGDVARLDLYAGPGGRDGAPVAPYQFVAEHSTGTNPCISVCDAKGRVWRVKWGDEVRSETFAIRLAWAVGYHVEVTYFIPSGRIEGAENLTRAQECIGPDCTFQDARFELDDPQARKLFDEHGWSWDQNPFVGTRELNGLKIIMILMSNWDNKDVRDVARGSNTAIFEYALPDGTIEARYLIIDWGATMGKWGLVGFRGKWDCAAYEAQTAQFITGVKDGFVKWGYLGQRTEDATDNISVEDVRWLMQYLGQLTDTQIEAALRASGATPEEVDCFTRALRVRINLLEQVVQEGNNYQVVSA